MLVGIIDYGSGNIRSVFKSFEKAASLISSEIQIKIIKNTNELKKIEKIVLPGVGAFADCMEGLKKRPGLIEMLNLKVLKENKPFLGICVGMQLLANSSSEYGHTEGLSWLEGKVDNIKAVTKEIKIPHMGWNSLIFNQNSALLNNIKKGEDFYFVHSYQFDVKENNFVLATTNYGTDITAIVLKNNILGTQFHPEKSQKAGIQFIKNFLEWKP